MVSDFANEWDIDPATIYLNHGSFGPSPKVVREAREADSRELERQPMKFLCQVAEERLAQCGARLATTLNTKSAHLALVDNATIAMNIAAASTPLFEGDEVLLTDHEYGAVKNIWQQRCQQTGAEIRTVELPFPPSPEATVAAVKQAFTDRTRVFIASHVTSATAVTLPVAELCAAARQRGITTAIDGPHALAMRDIDLKAIGCDYYCCSGHKWLCAGFGSGFLYVRPGLQESVTCPVVSWGGSIAGRAPSWQDATNWLGTRDPASLLSIEPALDFFKSIGGVGVFRRYAHGLLVNAFRQLQQIDGVKPFGTPDESDFVSMFAVELPQPAGWKPGYHGHPDGLQLRLRSEYGIEAPVFSWKGHRLLRVSAHLYNKPQDFEVLTNALEVCLQAEA